MWLDIVAILLLVFFVGMGAVRGMVASAMAVISLGVAYAAAIIVAHNHPSGQTEPSHEDIEVTKRLQEAGKILGIVLLDHLIVSENKFTSLKEQGAL